MDMISQIGQLVPTDSRVSIGRFTYGNPAFKLWGMEESIEIGSYCSIADNVTIFGGGEHNTDWVTTFPLRLAYGDPYGGKDGLPSTKGKTRIGNDVWIGYGTAILSGVTVNDGAVIGAYSLITKDVLPYSIVGGNPAKLIKYRFTDQQISELLKIQWWNWPHARIIKFMDLLSSNDIDRFIDTVNNYKDKE
jgi:acetyltransferase-like isoleucine patch superfamily enzyme